MPSFNDIDLRHWQESEVWTESLWMIPEREKGGKHSNFYHGNFVPQIPHQLLLRYTKKGDTVLDPFLGSGTTAYKCESLGRNCVGIELQSNLVEEVQSHLDEHPDSFVELVQGDSTQQKTFDEVQNRLQKHGKTTVQFALLHPPYASIIPFSDDPADLSRASSLHDFLQKFSVVLQNTVALLEKGRHLAIVMGDMYTTGQWVPLGFYCMNEAQKVGLALKSVVVKNMEGNRAKLNKEGIWRYRALSSDYYVFKHEYIFIFKKTV